MFIGILIQVDLGGQALQHGRFDRARANRIDINIVLRHLHGQSLGKSDDTVFGSRIMYRQSQASQTGHGRNIDDLAILLLDHLWYGIFAAKKRPFEAHVQYFIPGSFGQLID